MRKIKDKFLIAVVDDDSVTATEIENVCLNYFNREKVSVDIVTFNNAVKFNETQIIFDLVMLDVEMPNVSGIQLAKKIRKLNIKTYICFITSFPQYMFDAYKVHAFDYIMKPASTNKIEKMLSEFLLYNSTNETDESILCTFNTTIGAVEIEINNIIYFEYLHKSAIYKNRSTKLVLVDNKEFIVKEKINSIMMKLPMDYFFIPHQSFIVNFSHISQIVQHEIILDNEAVIPLSQKKAADFKKKYSYFVKDKYL